MGLLVQRVYLVLALATEVTLAARILAVLPMPAPSHHHLFRAVLTTLADRGHQVVSYTSVPMNKPTANYTEIHLRNVEDTAKSLTLEKLIGIMNFPPVGAATMVFSEENRMINQTFQDSEFKELLKSNDKFDIIFLEALFGQETLLGLAHIFKAPVICLQPFGSFSLVNKVSGNSLALSFIPDFSFPFSNSMSMYERSLNSYSILKTLFLYYNSYLPKQNELMKNYYNDPTMPSLQDLHQYISLFVNNAHPYIHPSQPYTPNIIPVGGIHIGKGRQPLPPDLKKFCDEAEHGLIYFALGSFLPDHLLSKEYFDNFINVFRRLPQRVLWKTGLDLQELPDNVMTAKWVPQQDVLGHRNVVLFMTHGGLFSQHEAINAGVPVVCTPYFGDQPMNAKFYEEKGVGVRLFFKDLSEETIFSAITTVLNNTSYKARMQELSRMYRDRPMSPADSLVFWVEHVLRHGGAPHLRPASALMPWYQLSLLDVLAVLLLAAVSSLLLIYLAIKTVMRYLGRGKQPCKNSNFITKKND